jgi:FAS-associated factor 2
MENELTSTQTEKVIQFQDITQIDDINVCRDMLIRHNWDLEVAFQEHIAFQEGRPSMYATEARPPAVLNDRYLQHVFSSSRDPPSSITGYFSYVVNYFFNFCYSTISSILSALFNLFRDRERSEYNF